MNDTIKSFIDDLRFEITNLKRENYHDKEAIEKREIEISEKEQALIELGADLE